MPDLMSGTYTYDALVKKYDNFCAPLIKIIVNGKDLVSTMKLSIVEMKVTLSLEAAGMAVFKIGGVYEEDKQAFDSKVKNKFALGSIVEVELGYRSSSLKIFKGFVAMLGAEFYTTPCMVVTLMDARRLMMLSGNEYMLHDVKNYSDAFQAVIRKYSKLCTAVVDATNDKLAKPLSQIQNDYFFITKELLQKGKVDREFFVLGDKVYFRKPRKVKQSIMTLQYGRELLSMKIDEEYQDLKIQVIGYDGEAQNVIQGSTVVKKNSSLKAIMSSTPNHVLTDPSADTQAKANAKSKVIAKEKEWKVCSGKGVTVGLPELVPGRFVSIKSLEKGYDKYKYYIKSVVHEIREDNFETVFEIGGWK